MQHTTAPDQHGWQAEVTTFADSTTVNLSVGPADDSGDHWGGADLTAEDALALATTILRRLGHVAITEADAREAAALAGAVGAPLHPLRDRLRAAEAVAAPESTDPTADPGADVRPG